MAVGLMTTRARCGLVRFNESGELLYRKRFP